MSTVRIFKRKWKIYFKNESEIKATIGGMKNILEWINSRLGDTEECISDLEDRIMEISQLEEQKEK